MDNKRFHYQIPSLFFFFYCISKSSILPMLTGLFNLLELIPESTGISVVPECFHKLCPGKCFGESLQQIYPQEAGLDMWWKREENVLRADVWVRMTAQLPLSCSPDKLAISYPLSLQPLGARPF